MPRVVDHQRRRTELAEAVWRVILRDGVEAATVRAVAAEAGWSPGALRHYFASQQELLGFAAGLVLQRVPERVLRVLADPALLPAQRARLALEEVLPLDDERRVEALVWLAFTDRARVDAGYAEARLQAWRGLRQLCRRAVADLRGAAPPDGPDGSDDSGGAQPEVVALHALLDGLALQAVSYPEHMPPERLSAVLSAHLAQLTLLAPPTPPAGGSPGDVGHSAPAGRPAEEGPRDEGAV